MGRLWPLLVERIVSRAMGSRMSHGFRVRRAALSPCPTPHLFPCAPPDGVLDGFRGRRERHRRKGDVCEERRRVGFCPRGSRLSPGSLEAERPVATSWLSPTMAVTCSHDCYSHGDNPQQFLGSPFCAGQILLGPFPPSFCPPPRPVPQRLLPSHLRRADIQSRSRGPVRSARKMEGPAGSRARGRARCLPSHTPQMLWQPGSQSSPLKPQ